MKLTAVNIAEDITAISKYQELKIKTKGTKESDTSKIFNNLDAPPIQSPKTLIKPYLQCTADKYVLLPMSSREKKENMPRKDSHIPSVPVDAGKKSDKHRGELLMTPHVHKRTSLPPFLVGRNLNLSHHTVRYVDPHVGVRLHRGVM